MDRRRESVRYLRDTAVRLLEIAADMESPRTIAATCSCDVCGDQAYRANLEGERCLSHKLAGKSLCRCSGRYRLDPEPATDRDGSDLGVSLAELAEQGMRDFERGMRDFLAEDPDNDDEITAEWPDIASTYRGRLA